MIRPSHVVILAAMLLCCAGCDWHLSERSQPTEGQPVASGDGAAYRDEVLALQAQLDELERRLGGQVAGGVGRGGLSEGPSLRLTGAAAGDSLLDRLRDLQGRLAAAEARIAADNETIEDLRGALARSQQYGTEMKAQAEELIEKRRHLAATQAELRAREAERQELIAERDDMHVRMLEAEKRYFLLAKRVLELEADDPQDVAAMQEDVHEQVQSLQEIRRRTR